MIWRQVLERVIDQAAEEGLALEGLTASPLRGPAGNIEYLATYRLGGARPPEAERERWIGEAMRETEELETGR
jgi:23S rRNA (cytidine1920-2'-O)/16S rRNA (cytidine1409-2'-O)-methyltransferase